MLRSNQGKNERGSLLVASYFMMAVLLSLAIPQSMRALHFNRLVRLNVAQQTAFHVTEAARARLLRIMLSGASGSLNPTVSNPFFGEQEDPDTDNLHVLGTRTDFPGVNSCNGVNGPTDWDCWPDVYQVENAGVTYNVSFRAQEIPHPPTSGWVTKRVQLVLYRVDNSDITTTFDGQWLTTHEVKVRLNRSGEYSGVKAGTRLIVGAGNGVEHNIIKSQYVLSYGDAISSGAVNYADTGAITVEGSQAIWGRILVKDTPGFDLCCDGAGGVGWTDELVLTNSGNDARVRLFPMDYPQYWRTLSSSPSSMGGYTSPEYLEFDSRAPRVADMTGIRYPAPPPPASSEDLPANLPAGADIYNPDPVMPQSIPEVGMYGADLCTQQINGPGGSGAHSITLCVASATNPAHVGLLAQYQQGICGAGGDVDPSDDHDIYNIGRLAADGVTVEYCVGAVDIGQGTELRVQGDKARVLIRGYEGAHVAMAAGANSTIFAFKKSETPQIPLQNEYIHTFPGISGSAEELDNFRNALSNPAMLGHLSIEVLENNKYKRADMNSPWQRLVDSNNNTIKYPMTEVFNNPLSSNDGYMYMAPEVHIHGDIFLGTINAPRSDVTLAANFAETRSTANPMVAFRMFWSGNTLLVTPKADGVGDGTKNISNPAVNELLAWRRCYTQDCSL